MHRFDFFRDIFSVFGAFSRFFGVKFGFRKSCQCKRNDKYEVCPLSLPGTSTTPTSQFRSDQQRGLPVLRSSPSATWAELTFSGWSTDLDTFPHSYLAWRAPVFDFPPGSWSPRCFSSPPPHPRPSYRLCLVHRYPGLRTPGTELPGTRPHTPPEIRSWLLFSKLKILPELQLQNLDQTLYSKSEQMSSTSATVTTSTSFELASSHARVTSIKFTKQELVSE